MRPIGFSTGALAKGDFRAALTMLAPHRLPAIELSALRMDEVEPLITAVPSLNLDGYSQISFHAPSKFSQTEEERLVQRLFQKLPANWTIVLHPDSIFDFGLWRQFGSRLAIENMDRRKPCGRSRAELELIFAQLPEAMLCFDIGHARQFDASMTEAYLILTTFADRLAQVHISEVNTQSQHDAISYSAKVAFQIVAKLVPDSIPIVIESRVSGPDISREIAAAIQAMSPVALAEAEQTAKLAFA